MSAPIEVPEVPAPDAGSLPLDAAIVAVVTAALTYAVRKYLTRKDEGSLDDKPQVLFWVSAAASVIGGAINAVVQGQGVKSALLAAVSGWLAAQGLRRAKKGVGIV